MYAVLLFLASAAVIGSRAATTSSRIPRYLLIALSIALAISLASLRVIL